MKNNITVEEIDMPTLRQMVLENSRQISKNEMQIKEMRMENTEQAQKDRERDERWEESRRKHDSDMEEIRALQKVFQQQMIESSARNDLALKKSREEFDRRMQESQERHDRDMAEIKELHHEMNKNIKEATDEIKSAAGEIKGAAGEIKGAAGEIKSAAAKVDEMVVEIRGITGHIVEGLISTTTKKIFQNAGLDLYNKGKEIKRKLTAKNLMMEVDVLLDNATTTVPIEVKSNCTKSDIDHFIEAMGKFRVLFPEYASHEVIAGIAALNYERDAFEYAQQQGLLVIRVSSDYIFSLAPFDRQSLRRF